MVLLVLLAASAVLTGATGILDLSTPEQTVASYLAARRQGDRVAAAKTFLREDEPTDYIQSGVDMVYEIMEKRLILESKLNKQPGDVQIVTHLTLKWPKGPVEMVTTFQLRKVDARWKIVAFDSIKPGVGSPD